MARGRLFYQHPVRRLLTILVGLSLVLTAAPAEAEVTQQQLRDAREEANARAADLSAQLEELDQIQSQQAAYEARIAGLQEQITDRQREIALSELAAKEQARAMYVSAGSSAGQAAATPEGITRLGTKNAYLEMVVDTDTDAANRLTFLQEDAAALQDQLGPLLAQQEDLANQASALSDEMQQQLSEANADYQALYSQWQKEDSTPARCGIGGAARRRPGVGRVQRPDRRHRSDVPGRRAHVLPRLVG